MGGKQISTGVESIPTLGGRLKHLLRNIQFQAIWFYDINIKSKIKIASLGLYAIKEASNAIS